MRNQKGETITETLISVVIVAICFIALQAAVIASARVNDKAKSLQKPFIVGNEVDNNRQIFIKREGNETEITNEVPVKKSGEVNGANPYYYFE